MLMSVFVLVWCHYRFRINCYGHDVSLYNRREGKRWVVFLLVLVVIQC